MPGPATFFAEQAFLSKKMAFRWARIMKFLVGWASHLYYWVYPGVMVGVTALLIGYLGGQVFPKTFSTAIPSPLLMFLFALIFSFGVAYIAFRGVGGTTGVNGRHQRDSNRRAADLLGHGDHPPGKNIPKGRPRGRWTTTAIRSTLCRTRRRRWSTIRTIPAKRWRTPPGRTDPRNDTAGNAIPVFEVVDKAGNPVNGTDGQVADRPVG